ncbi:MAG: aldo/keto reductase, partial [Micrococcales bacterium]
AFLPWSPSKGVTAQFEGSEIHTRFSKIAQERNVSVFSVALAWLRTLSPNIVPIPGVTRFESILDHLGALDFRLTEADRAALEDLPESMPIDDELARHQPIPE